MSDKQQPPRKYIDIPEAERELTARHEATHAAYYLVLCQRGVQTMRAKKRIQKKAPQGLVIRDTTAIRRTQKVGFIELIATLAPWKVRRIESGEIEYGARKDVADAWNLALGGAALEHDPPLVPQMVASHRELVEKRARTYIVAALDFVEKHHEQVKPLIDALAQALIEHEELDQDHINAIYHACGSPRIPITDIP